MRAIAASIDDEEALPEELRDVEAPAAEPADAGEDDTGEAEDEQADDQTEGAEANDDGDDGDDDGDGADALGDMFG